MENVNHLNYLLKLGLCRGLQLAPWDYMISVQAAFQLFLGTMWGEVDLEKDWTGSMVHGRGRKGVP